MTHPPKSVGIIAKTSIMGLPPIASTTQVAVMKNMELPRIKQPTRCTMGALGFPLKKTASASRLVSTMSGQTVLRCLCSIRAIHSRSSSIFASVGFGSMGLVNTLPRGRSCLLFAFVVDGGDVDVLFEEGVGGGPVEVGFGFACVGCGADFAELGAD